MTVLALSTRVCSSCLAEKPTSEFYVDRPGRRWTTCKSCERVRAAAALKRRIEREGGEAVRSARAAAVRRHRAKTGDARNRAMKKTRDRAVATLVAAHRKEFDAILFRERYDAGLV